MRATSERFVEEVVPEVTRPLRVIWNQAIGFVFLTMSLLALRPLMNEWQQAGEGKDGAGVRLALLTIFTALMAGYGLFSILRARKVARSGVRKPT